MMLELPTLMPEIGDEGVGRGEHRGVWIDVFTLSILQ
jgi:hypothetical protein